MVEPLRVPVPVKVIQALALLNAVMPDLDRADVILLRDVVRHARCLLASCGPDKEMPMIGGEVEPSLAQGVAVVRELLACLFDGDESQDWAFEELSGAEQERVVAARLLARRWLAAVEGGGDAVSVS